MSGKRYKYFTKFSRFVLFEFAASTMRKIKPVIVVTEGLFIYIYFMLFNLSWPGGDVRHHP